MKAMGEAMAHRDWYVVETHTDARHGLGLGRIGIGIFNKASQPVWNEDHTVALVMAGELYNPKTPDSSGKSDEQVALDLYEEIGEGFVSRLNGAFIMAIWDKRRNQLLSANDRFGLYPLYYTCRDGRLVFAPEMKGCLCDETFPRELDLTALAQYMRLQHLLGERTFFEDLRLLPPASVLTFDLSTAECSVKAYWTFGDIPYRPEVTFEEAVEETGRLLRRAVQRLSSDSYRRGVFLSGGLDSRTILGMIERRPVASVTYGEANCRDVHYARRIARAVGSDHHWFDLSDAAWVREYAGFHLDLTEGFHSWIHAHGISMLPQARELMDVNLTGWDGGTLMGDADTLDPLLTEAVDNIALVTRLFDLLTHDYTWPSINEAEERLLYTDSFFKRIEGRALESLCDDLKTYCNYRPDVRSAYFYINNHCRRFTFNMVTFARSHVEVRFPFFDYHLFCFLHSLPVLYRSAKLLYRAVLQQQIPHLVLIPYDHDELLPTTRSLIRGAHSLARDLTRRFNRHLWPVFRERSTLYVDYENHLRADLKKWGESILFGRRTLDRGIFDPTFLRSIWARHQSGQEPHTIGKIAPIMTYEMMLRRLHD